MEKNNKINLPLIAICSFVIVTVVMILLGIMVCKLPVVTVCIIVILETGIAMCLHNCPIGVHFLMFAAALVAGILCEQILFIIFAEIVYAMAVLAIHFLGNE